MSVPDKAGGTPSLPQLGRRGLLRASLATVAGRPALAQSRAETLRAVTAGTVNTLDSLMLGATPEATALGAATYDRLLRFGRTPRGDGTFVFDGARLEGELAERHEVSPDGLTITLHLRPDATWHDGSPVTAEDVKWSFDRAVSAPTMAKAQLATGSLTDPGQMTIRDRLVVQIALERADRLAAPNLATLYAPMLDSKLARRHATEGDPWATAWLADNIAGGGAYRLESVAPGERVTLLRNRSWVCGARPGFERVILQTVPDASTRRSLIEKGDADLATGLQPDDLRALEHDAAVKVVSTPMPTGFGALIFGTRLPPFDRVEVRRALAHAIPYDAVFAAALGGRGGKLYGAPWSVEPPTPGFPQALPLHTDLGAARRELAAAGLPDGFDTTLTYSASRAPFADPAAALIQEAFAKVGVRVSVRKLPDAQFAQAVTEKRLPMLLERSFALFPAADYVFRIFASGPSRWNFSSWNDPETDALLAQARYEPDDARYDRIARRLIGRFADQVPMAMIWQPTDDVVMSRSVTGFTTWYTYHPDFRDLARE